MAFVLNRNKGQRMWGGGSNTFNGGRTGGGGSGAGGGGGVNSQWIDDNYVSKNYFNQLFEVKVHVVVTDTTADPQTVISDTTRVLAPNEVLVPTSSATDPDTQHVIVTTMTITGIQVKAGLWTEQYLSALGQNSSGGGGGGGTSLNEPLASINNAGLASHPSQSGQTIIWNGSAWVYGSTGGGSVTSITAGTGLSGGTITGSGTIAIDITYQQYIADGETAYGWGNHADAGYATQSWVTNQNFLTQTAGDGRYLTISFFRSLFRAYNSSSNEVQPNNGDTSTIDNIKAMFGFWTDQYLSALGQSSGGGGGGGGSSTLAGLNDVNLSSLAANDVLTYDGSGHWVNTSKSTFLNGYATQQWVQSQDYLTGITSQLVTTALGFTPLSNATTFWGQSVNNGVVSGSLTGVGDITFENSENHRINPNGNALYIGNSNNASWVYLADMASQSGDSYWKVYANGNAHFKRIYLDTNVYLEYDSTTGGIHVVGAGLYADTFISALGVSSS